MRYRLINYYSKQKFNITISMFNFARAKMGTLQFISSLNKKYHAYKLKEISRSKKAKDYAILQYKMYRKNYGLYNRSIIYNDRSVYLAKISSKKSPWG